LNRSAPQSIHLFPYLDTNINPCLLPSLSILDRESHVPRVAARSKRGRPPGGTPQARRTLPAGRRAVSGPAGVAPPRAHNRCDVAIDVNCEFVKLNDLSRAVARSVAGASGRQRKRPRQSLELFSPGISKWLLAWRQLQNLRFEATAPAAASRIRSID